MCINAIQLEDCTQRFPCQLKSHTELSHYTYSVNIVILCHFEIR